MNSIAERWVRSIKSESLDRMILFGEGSLERATKNFTAHYNLERPHQGLDNELISGRCGASEAPSNGEVVGGERLGGLLMHYDRAAA